MSVSDDEEALFDDIYGSEEEKETTKKESETKVESTTESDSKDDKLEEKSKDDTKEEGGDDSKKDESVPPSTTSDTNNDASTTSTPQFPTATSTTAPLQPSIASTDTVAAPVQSNSSSNHQKVDLSRDAGKMFIGGLDWDTTEDRMKEYFSKFGEVIDHTIMRESSTGRSRGFGFLTFAHSSSVDEVVKTQHVLDGKVIDPKRAIPREEQDKTGKIFVGGIAPEVRPKEFEEFFSKFGTIIDAQLMLDKDTGRSRGFGFVTFDAPDAVDKVCQGRYLDFNGRQIEVKRAEPRGPQQQQNHIQQQQQRYMQQQGGGYGGNQGGQFPTGVAGLPNPAVAGGVPGGQYYGGFTPETMTQYWQQMQQYWLQFQQQQQSSGQVSGDMAANFQNFAAQQFQQAGQPQQAQQAQSQQAQGEEGQEQQFDQGGDNGGSYGGQYRRRGAPMNAPRGPRGGGRGGRGRGRGYNGGYHPYSRS